jgi:hypothetical protein
VKRKDHIANTNEAPVFKQRSALDYLLVQERAVAAIEVFDEKLRTFPDYLAVISADGANINYDIAFGMPAKDRFRAVEIVSPTGLWAIICCEKAHPRMILGVK